MSEFRIGFGFLKPVLAVSRTQWRKSTYPHLLQGFGQHIATLLLVDKDDDGRIKALFQNSQQFLPAQGEERKERNKKVAGTGTLDLK